MTLYEMTPDGPRPLSLAEAAHRVYLALCAARPGARTRTRLIGLRDLANELAIEEALREREARYQDATTQPHRGKSIQMFESLIRRAGMVSVDG